MVSRPAIEAEGSSDTLKTSGAALTPAAPEEFGRKGEGAESLDGSLSAAPSAGLLVPESALDPPSCASLALRLSSHVFHAGGWLAGDRDSGLWASS